MESASGEYICSNCEAVSESTTDRIISGREYTSRPTRMVGRRNVAAATATYAR